MHYNLDKDENVLFKSNIKLKSMESIVEFILTTQKFIFIISNGFGNNNEIIVQEIPIKEVKIYNGLPQINRKGNLVEIFMINDDIELVFKSMFEAHKFMDIVYKLITNKSKFERGVAKVKGGVDVINETFNVDCVHSVGSVFNRVGRTLDTVNNTLNVVNNTLGSVNNTLDNVHKTADSFKKLGFGKKK